MFASAALFAACADVRPTESPSHPVYTVIVSPDTATIAVSDTLRLAVALFDANGTALSGRAVTWSSDAAGIAAVSPDGLVSAADSGTATISATSEGKVATARVKVHGHPATDHAGFFVSPSGSSTADGSIDHPWDLPTALANASSRVQPGDTIWLRGGTYRGNFRSMLSGTASQPIVVRQYPGERAIIDGATGNSTASTWYVGGQYSVFWGFELINSDPNRVLSSTGRRYNVVANYANHTKYIDLIVHDGGVAFYNESPYYDVEIVGCIIYDEGWQGPDRGHGHAIYLRSNTGPVTARDNIMFNQFGYGVHVFTNPGEGQLDNIHLDGNVSFNNGTLSNNSNSSNILFGGDDYSTGGVLQNNMTYESPGVPGPNIEVGYGATVNGTVQLSNNYIAAGGTVLAVGYWSSLTASSNQLIGTGQILQINDPSISASTFSGQTQGALPTLTKVVVRPNPYEAGRANIVVYNWGGQSAVSVDLSAIVPRDAQFQIRNVQDWFGTPVVSGIYSGGSVSIPIRSVTPPTPIGMSSSPAPSTGTAFATYVVTIQGQ
ncbi:MAG TPA: Ig-like domain-containing protein [Gemmatimonadales bacterium]|nr:Ig-like domain-containing protein [Gemmatimonadales bacterium]